MSERRNDDNDDEFDNTTTKFLYAFTQSVLNSDKSIRWVAITDQDGNIIMNKIEEKDLNHFLLKKRTRNLQ
jgi:hypothetical protein